MLLSSQKISSAASRAPERGMLSFAVRFVTPVYHPNISESGLICLSILNLKPKARASQAPTFALPAACRSRRPAPPATLPEEAPRIPRSTVLATHFPVTPSLAAVAPLSG